MNRCHKLTHVLALLAKNIKTSQTDFWGTNNKRIGVQQSSNLRTFTRETMTLAEGAQGWNLDRKLMTRKQSIQVKKLLNWRAVMFLCIFCMVTAVKVNVFLISNRQYLFCQLILLLSVECQTCTGNTELHQKQQE